MPQNLRKSMVLDGIAASEAIDSSGEILDIKGLDITSLKDGSGVLNYEHRGDQSEGASANDIIGHITFAKKIFGPDDCENDREMSYWNKVQLPFVYIQAELFNDEGHPGAVAAASLIRYYQSRKLPILMRYSIEGSTLDRDGNRLKRAIAKRVAATIKPCNRSCISGVLSDGSEVSEKSKDELHALLRYETESGARFVASVEGEFEPIVDDPMEKMRSAIDDLRELNDLSKAFSAGGFNAAPSSLSGGSALQAENFGETEKRKKFIKNQVMGAMRDWRGRGNLRKFLKARMPDTSEDFIEHFAKLVEDYQLKKFADLEDTLNKAVAGQSAVQRNAADALSAKKPDHSEQIRHKANKQAAVEQHHAKVSVGHAEEVEDMPEEKLGDAPLTVRGRNVRVNASVDRPFFDERKGILHTQRGSFPMYLPQHDKHSPGALESFHNALNDPKASQFHDYAVSNWLKVHKLLKEGKLPPEVIMHSTLFSQLSPNTPVPMQELMYSHLVDAMKQKGVDARSPQFANLKDEWVSRDQPDKLPDHSQGHFANNPSVRLKHDAKPGTTGRKAGDVSSFMLANNKFKNMEQYHSLHDSLAELFGRHRHDARSAVAELMAHKHKSALWEAKRKRDIGKGLVDPGEYSAGPAVPGLAPKTGRYMAAMIGGGNVHVPDTHFTRYLFGLEKGTDGRSIAYLKQKLWDPNNSHILDAIDRFYSAHHPAVQHMMDHPVFGKHFDSREDAVFPAFWKNWIAIAPHERARKMKTMAYNEATDHRPFWEAIQPFMKSEGLTLPMQTARLHAKWVQEHGEIPAQMLYYAHIVPQLLRASRRSEDMIVKMQQIADDLRKAMEPAPEPPLPAIKEADTTGLHKFGDHFVKPGEIEITAGQYKGSKLHYLGKNPFQNKHFVKSPTGQFYALSSHAEGHAFRVNSEPEKVAIPQRVDADPKRHGDFINTSFAQKSLAHGIDMSERRGTTKANTYTKDDDPHGYMGWYENHAGVVGLVKPDVAGMWDATSGNDEYVDAQNSYPLANRGVLFKNMARDFFGLDEHVPNTARFRHPVTGHPMSVMERVLGAQHFDHDDDVHGELLDKMHKSGKLDQMVLMDMAMGQNDRNPGNYMLTEHAPHVHLIDNEMALDYANPVNEGYLWEHQHHSATDGQKYAGHREIHPAAIDWLLKLDHKDFAKRMIQQGVPPLVAKAGMHRLQAMQMAAMESRAEGSPFVRADLTAAINAHSAPLRANQQQAVTR